MDNSESATKPEDGTQPAKDQADITDSPKPEKPQEEAPSKQAEVSPALSSEATSPPTATVVEGKGEPAVAQSEAKDTKSEPVVESKQPAAQPEAKPDPSPVAEQKTPDAATGTQEPKPQPPPSQEPQSQTATEVQTPAAPETATVAPSVPQPTVESQPATKVPEATSPQQAASPAPAATPEQPAAPVEAAEQAPAPTATSDQPAAPVVTPEHPAAPVATSEQPPATSEQAPASVPTPKQSAAPVVSPEKATSPVATPEQSAAAPVEGNKPQESVQPEANSPTSQPAESPVETPVTTDSASVGSASTAPAEPSPQTESSPPASVVTDSLQSAKPVPDSQPVTATPQQLPGPGDQLNEGSLANHVPQEQELPKGAADGVTTEPSQKESPIAQKTETVLVNGEAKESAPVISEFSSPELKKLTKTSPGISITFSWEHGGQEVALTGSFANWEDPHVLLEQDGKFSLNMNLSEGEYHYKYLVDGNWTTNSNQPVTELDGHGKVNVMVVKAEGNED